MPPRNAVSLLSNVTRLYSCNANNHFCQFNSSIRPADISEKYCALDTMVRIVITHWKSGNLWDKVCIYQSIN